MGSLGKRRNNDGEIRLLSLGAHGYEMKAITRLKLYPSSTCRLRQRQADRAAEPSRSRTRSTPESSRPGPCCYRT